MRLDLNGEKHRDQCMADGTVLGTIIFRIRNQTRPHTDSACSYLVFFELQSDCINALDKMIQRKFEKYIHSSLTILHSFMKCHTKHMVSYEMLFMEVEYVICEYSLLKIYIRCTTLAHIFMRHSCH